MSRKPKKGYFVRGQFVAEGFGARAQFFFGDHVEYRQRRGHGQWVGGVGAAQAAGCRRVHDVCAAADSRQWHASGQAFGHGHQVGAHAEMLQRKHLPRARKAGLHLVGDEDATGAPDNVADRHQMPGLGQDAGMPGLGGTSGGFPKFN